MCSFNLKWNKKFKFFKKKKPQKIKIKKNKKKKSIFEINDSKNFKYEIFEIERNKIRFAKFE